MKAMILAAGLGSRLRPLTLEKPKALIEVGGRPLLEHVIARLKRFGVDEIIMNVHHFAQQIMDFVARQNQFGIRIEFSIEETLLDTGGGLQKAAWFFDKQQPFILQNVDVLTDLDFDRFISTHQKKQALATLAVRDRKTSRYLLFDLNERLIGWRSAQTGRLNLIRQPKQPPIDLSFMGVHVISPRIFSLLQKTGRFPILPAYLELARAGEKIIAYRADSARWLDLGRPENLSQVEKIFGAEFPI